MLSCVRLAVVGLEEGGQSLRVSSTEISFSGHVTGNATEASHQQHNSHRYRSLNGRSLWQGDVLAMRIEGPQQSQEDGVARAASPRTTFHEVHSVRESTRYGLLVSLRQQAGDILFGPQDRPQVFTTGRVTLVRLRWMDRLFVLGRSAGLAAIRKGRTLQEAHLSAWHKEHDSRHDAHASSTGDCSEAMDNESRASDVFD